MKKIFAFDFDGTLTYSDSLLAFIKFAKGQTSMYLGFLLFSPLLVLMKLHLYPNWKAKQLIFSYFFKGMHLSVFNNLCERFARENKEILRPEGIKFVKEAIGKNHQVVIVSASIDNWVMPFFQEFGNRIIILGTQIEAVNGILTGSFLSANCYGEEKVNRLKEVFPNRSDYYLLAYGDSRGDKELLNYADEGHYKPFHSQH